MSIHLSYSRRVALAAVLCMIPASLIAQMPQSDYAKQAASAPTPRTPDGHPDFTGLWNGAGDGLVGTRNQMTNAGIDIQRGFSKDVHSGAMIATFAPEGRGTGIGPDRGTAANGERDNALLRRIGSNKPLYKPEYWDKVKDLDAHTNTEDPSMMMCMAAGMPRVGAPAQIAQSPTQMIFLYPGQGGLISTQTTYRQILTDGRQHTAPDDLDDTWNGESIGHWEGDTMVIDTIGINGISWMDQVGGYFHSNKIHVTERIERHGNTLIWQATIEDPEVLLKPWVMNPRVALLNPNPKAVLPESPPCSERDLAHTVTMEHH